MRRWITLTILAAILIGLAYPVWPSAAQTITQQEALILSGDPKLPASVYVFAQNDTSYGIYYLEDRDWRLITSIPVSAVTVDTVQAKLSPDRRHVAYMITDGETGNSAIFVTDLFGISETLIYTSDQPELAATSFAWHGDKIAYTLARGPFAGEAGAEGVINPLDQAAAAPYAGEVWLSTVDGAEHIQLVAQGAGEVLGSVSGEEPLFYTTVDTNTQQLSGLNSIAANGTITTLLRSQVDETGQGTVYLSFDLVQTAPGVTRIAAVVADEMGVTIPDDGTRLVTMALDGSDAQEVLRDPFDIGAAAWSPQGDKVAIVRHSTGEALIHDLAQGTTQTLPVAVQTNLQWNADGSAIIAARALNADTNPFTKGVVALGLDGTTVASVETMANAVTQFYQYIVPGFDPNTFAPYVHQKIDTPANFDGKNVSCGSASTVMALAALGRVDGNLGELVAQFHNGHRYNGRYVPSASYGREPAEAALRAYGIDQIGGPPYNSVTQQHHLYSLQDIINMLERGRVVIMSTNLTAAGHIVLVIGYKRYGSNDVRLIVNDSWGNANLQNYGNERNGAGVAYTWEQMRRGWGWAFAVNAVAQPVISPNQWRAEYYNNTNLWGNPALVRGDNEINFNWGSGSPAPNVGSDNFSVRWSRQVWFDRSGVYRFTVNSDDGMRMFIDGRPVLNYWDRRGAAQTDVYLSAGSHHIIVEYVERTGLAYAQVGWWYLVSNITWEGSYFNNRYSAGSPVFIRNDPSINFNWQQGSPDHLVSADNFSVLWQRRVYLPGGAWIFYAKADDTSKVYLDGQLVLDQWQPYARANTVPLPRAGEHELKVYYAEHTGPAYITFSFWPKVLAEYWDRSNFTGNYRWEAIDTVDKDWGWGGPHNSWWQDNFSARFTWPVSLSGGEYRICVQADDGFRFYVDNELRFERWSYKNETTCQKITIRQGWRTFRIDHREDGGWAKLRVTWGRADRNVWYGTASPSMLTNASLTSAEAQPATTDDVAEFFRLLHDRGTLGLGLTAETAPIHTVNVPLVVR